jgi:hypothetical protein
LKRNDSRFIRIDNNVDISVDLLPRGGEYKYLRQIASSPYLIRLTIDRHLESLDNIQIDNILLIINNKTINLLDEDFYIYDSSLKRNYNRNEKDSFLSSGEIKSHFSSSDWIVVGFNNVEIIYKEVAFFEIVINIKLQYHDNSFESKEIRYKFFRKKSSEILLPTT